MTRIMEYNLPIKFALKGSQKDKCLTSKPCQISPQIPPGTPEMHAKLIRLDEAKTFQGCVLTYGHFSTIHPGHIRYLRHARNLVKNLWLRLIGDGGSTSYPFNQQERAEALSLLGIADAVLLLTGK